MGVRGFWVFHISYSNVYIMLVELSRRKNVMSEKLRNQCTKFILTPVIYQERQGYHKRKHSAPVNVNLTPIILFE